MRNSWPLVEIGELTSRVENVDPAKAFGEGEFSYVDISSIDSNSYKVVEPKICSGMKAPSRARQLIKENDIVFSTVRTNLRRIAKIGHDLDNHIASTGFAVLRAIPEVESSYLFYYLRSNEFIDEISAMQRGASYPAVRLSDVLSRKIPLAPLPEQKRIVAKLDTLFAHLDQLRSRLDKIPVLLKQFRQAVLTQAVTGKLTEEWRRENPDVENGALFTKRILSLRGIKNNYSTVTSENFPFEVPATWTFRPLVDFGELTRGKSKHRPRNDARLFGGEYPFIQTGDVARSEGEITDYKATYSDFGLRQSRLFPKGTLCITIAANIADTGILRFDACFPDSVVGYIPFMNLYSSEFAMFFLRTIKDNVEQYAPATAQKNINLNILNEILFPVPPERELVEIVKKVKLFLAFADRIEASCQLLKRRIDKLPQAVLLRAFAAELSQAVKS